MIRVSTLARQLAAELLRIRALRISPQDAFPLSSGMHSPMYCDNRLTMAYPHVRSLIVDGFEALLKPPLPDALVAVATAGIPHGAWLAERVHLPLAYVRSKPKGYGRRNQIEGVLREGQRTVLVEDVVASGASSLIAVDAVTKATGRPPEAVLCILAYGFPGVYDRFEECQSPLAPIISFEGLVNEAEARSYIDASEVETLFSFKRDPDAWSDNYLASIA